MRISYQAKRLADMPVLVVLASSEEGRFGARALALDTALSGTLRRARLAPRFHAKKGEILDLVAPAGTKARRVLVLGLGDVKKLDALAAREAGGALAAHLIAEHETSAEILVDRPKGAKIDEAALAVNLGLGMRLRNYRFDRFMTKPKPDAGKPIERAAFVVSEPKSAIHAAARLDALANGVALARDLTNEPPNELYPESFVARAKSLTRLGVKVEALDEKQMARLGLNALLAVGRGSHRPPRLLVLRYEGAGRGGKKPLAFVGKGVCFDSGGLCLKRPAAMYDMKGDMAGGAAVVGLFQAMAERKAKINAVGIVGLVENLPSGMAYKPGEIIKSMSGKTVEVIDTDAEGRLVLIDALYFTASRFKPRCIVDLATLTYSVMAGLGGVFAGLFSSEDHLADQLTAAGIRVGERLWRLPLDKEYDEHLESRIADLKHHADDSEHGDAPHAAALLRQFVGNTPWAHLDIAGREFHGKDRSLCPAGATGFGVQLLEEFVADLETGARGKA